MPRTVWCVRGPLSAELMGERASAALTDGAILAPAAFGIAASVDRSCVGVIPHWESELAGGWDLACAMAGFELISPSGTPRDVIGAIARKALIVTESLHGAIIADTLGIPWVAFATTGNFSLLKWADWSLSVGVNGRIHPVPSPSGGAVLKFGRFKGAGAGKAVVLERELALADYNAHMNWLFAPAGTSTPRFQFKARLKSLLNLAPVARVAGFSPESTAAALTRIARAEPQISDPALRRRLADEMTHRLATLRTRVGR
jgi:succinoglycan biosynthesis protein ExoV